MEDGDSLSSIFRSRGPRLSAHRAPPTSQHLKSHPLRSLPPARTQASGLLASEGGGRQGCQRLRKRLGASGSLFHSDPRPPRPRFSVLPRSQRKQLGQINGKLLRAGPRYSAPPPPGLRAGPQPPPRGVSDRRDLPRAAPPPVLPTAGAQSPAGGVGVGAEGSRGRGALTLGESIGESEDPDEEAQHAVRPPCARPRLGPGVGEGARGAGCGGGEPGSPPPTARARPYTLTRTLTRAHKLTSLPSASLYLSFLPVPSLSVSPPLSPSSLSPPPSALPLSPLLFLASSFISRGLFRSLLSLSLPFSSFPLSLLCPSS